MKKDVQMMQKSSTFKTIVLIVFGVTHTGTKLATTGILNSKTRGSPFLFLYQRLFTYALTLIVSTSVDITAKVQVDCISTGP